MIRVCFFLGIIITTLFAYKKGYTLNPTKLFITPTSLSFSDLKDNETYASLTYNDLNNLSVVKITFNALPLNLSSISGNIILTDAAGTTTAFTPTLENNDKRLVIKVLQPITKYII